jgi:hypothetical protein
MTRRLVALILALSAAPLGCSSSERPQNAGGSGGMEQGSGGTGGSPPKGGTGGNTGTGGASATGGSTGTGGSSATGGSTGTGGSGGTVPTPDASPGASPDAPPVSSGDLWSMCGPAAYKDNVSAADFCARYISVCKAGVGMDACMTQYNSMSDGPHRCRACAAYYACIASSAEVMAMACLYVSQGLSKSGPCKPSYCD